MYDGSIFPGAPVYGSCEGKTGLGSSFSLEYRNFLRKTWEAQVSSCKSLQSSRVHDVMCDGNDGIHLEDYHL